MIKHNLKEIVNFSKSNNNFSDYNIVNNFKLNFTKYKSINLKKQVGGVNEQNGEMPTIQNSEMPTIQNSEMPNMIVNQNSEMPNMVVNQNALMQPGQNNIMMMPDTYLEKPAYVTNTINTYSIPEGTILFYSTTEKRGFNTSSIQLNIKNLTDQDNISLFTPNFRLASDKIQGCSIDKQKGYIHTFKVIREIPDIYIRLPYDTDDNISLSELHDSFCSGNSQYNGVGFFYPKNEIDLFNNNMTSNNMKIPNITDESHYSEFYLCNPRPYLEYMYSQKCMSLRKLTDPYKFN